MNNQPATPSSTNASATASENWARYMYARDRGHTKYMAEATRCNNMYLGGGLQWNAEDVAVLDAEGRPHYEFNEIMPSINSALGYQIQNRMDIAFKPRGAAADGQTATLLSKVVMQVCDEIRLRWHETQIYGDGLIEQRGYYDLRMDFNKNIKGDVALDVLDPRDVIPDPDSKSYDPDKWGDVIVTRWLTLDEIEQRYGLKARDKAEASNDISQDFGANENEDERSKFGEGKTGTTGMYDAYGSDTNMSRYRIIDRQKFVFELTDSMVWPNTGDVQTTAMMTDEQITAATAQGAVKARRMRRRVKWLVSTYTATLFDSYSPYEDYTIVPFFAFFRRGQTRGLVDNGIGPQDVLNKAISQFVHILNSSANGGWTVEDGSLVNMDVKRLEQVGATTGLVVVYKKGTQAPSKILPNAVPSGVDRLIDRATQQIKDVTVPDAMRGLQGSAVSGVAKQADQVAGQQQLAVPMDNLNYTRQLLARRMVKLVQRYMDSYRVFRITETDPLTGKKTEKMLEINKFDPATGNYLNDVTIGEYDVVITEQPMQVTFENSQFNQALEMRKQGIALPDAAVVRYSNLADKEEILTTMQTNKPVDPTLEAKAALMKSQAAKADADTTARNVEAQYSAIQTAQVIATTPQTSVLADGLLKSAGYIDRDAAPIVPQLPPGMAAQPPMDMPTNTNPMTPANPGVGLMDGIETPTADGLAPEIGQ